MKQASELELIPLRLRIATRDPSRPQITGVDLLPSRGMNLHQIYGHLPGRGSVKLLLSSSLEELKRLEAEDPYGNCFFKSGGAFLIPFANRIRGVPEGDSIRTRVGSRDYLLPANWGSAKPNSERVSIHGMILKSAFEVIEHENGDTRAKIVATHDAGSFAGHWMSRTHLRFELALNPEGLEISLFAKNVGAEDLPMGIGWHPYFTILSGNRPDTRLRIPASNRIRVNNYEDVFPTGEREPLAGTKYDFKYPRSLGDLYLDDCFADLHFENGSTSVDLADPSSKCAIRLTTYSSEIRAFQIYAPADKAFVAIEPQFNLADPFNRAVWGSQPTGMVTLEPGQSTRYAIQLKWMDYAST